MAWKRTGNTWQPRRSLIRGTARPAAEHDKAKREGAGGPMPPAPVIWDAFALDYGTEEMPGPTNSTQLRLNRLFPDAPPGTDRKTRKR